MLSGNRDDCPLAGRPNDCCRLLGLCTMSQFIPYTNHNCCRNQNSQQIRYWRGPENTGYTHSCRKQQRKSNQQHIPQYGQWRGSFCLADGLQKDGADLLDTGNKDQRKINPQTKYNELKINGIIHPTNRQWQSPPRRREKTREPRCQRSCEYPLSPHVPKKRSARRRPRHQKQA